MKEAKDKILHQLLTILKAELKAELKEVILFGSYNSGMHTENSDFDVLIVLQNPADWRIKGKIRDLCYEISLKNDILIDSKIISEFELNHKFWGKHPLYTDTLKFGLHA